MLNFKKELSAAESHRLTDQPDHNTTLSKNLEEDGRAQCLEVITSVAARGLS
jgi:hypothetical protein|tara:strand:- start:125 stop:280 length:156 start_codon:yes stop_codon:yes gene_type:complete